MNANPKPLPHRTDAPLLNIDATVFDSTMSMKEDEQRYHLADARGIEEMREEYTKAWVRNWGLDLLMLVKVAENVVASPEQQNCNTFDFLQTYIASRLRGVLENIETAQRPSLTLTKAQMDNLLREVEGYPPLPLDELGEYVK